MRQDDGLVRGTGKRTDDGVTKLRVRHTYSVQSRRDPGVDRAIIKTNQNQIAADLQPGLCGTAVRTVGNQVAGTEYGARRPRLTQQFRHALVTDLQMLRPGHLLDASLGQTQAAARQGLLEAWNTLCRRRRSQSRVDQLNAVETLGHRLLCHLRPGRPIVDADVALWRTGNRRTAVHEHQCLAGAHKIANYRTVYRAQQDQATRLLGAHFQPVFVL